jgi:hypothetical protein
MDPGALSVAERAQYVATHVWEWRLGWLPWQLSALSNLWVCFALWRWAGALGSSAAKRAAGWALGWCVVAALPEQWAEAMLVTSFIDAAKKASPAWAHDWALYAGLTGVWANFGYTAMVGGWMVCARQLCAKRLAPRWLEASLLGIFFVSGSLTLAAVFAETAQASWFHASSAVNGIAFPSLILWSLLLWRQIGRAGDTRD